MNLLQSFIISASSCTRLFFGKYYYNAQFLWLSCFIYLEGNLLRQQTTKIVISLDLQKQYEVQATAS